MGFDELDKKILDMLRQGNFALPQATKIAQALKKPSTTIHQRLQKLEKSGIVKGYAPILNHQKLGKKITAFILLKTTPGIDPDVLAEKISGVPGVEEVHFVTGEWYYVVKIRANDLDDYYRISGETLVKMPELSEIMGMIAPRTYKE
jgi:DNA-binding Lrp family transcriptional regulator